MKKLLQRAYHKLSGKPSRAKSKAQQCVTLRPASEAHGNVLVAYILAPFLRNEGEPVSYAHTHHFESMLIAQTFLDLGFNVDVIDYRNKNFIPEKEYAFFVSARTYLEVIADRLNKDCIVIAHLDTSHYLFNNHAAYTRALELRQRRGIACPSIRLIEHNNAIERADYGIVLGNEHTVSTYAYSGTGLYPLHVPAPLTFPLPEKDYLECRRNFLWFGSSGFVHKGLDLVLEAFCKMPGLHLYICGPLDQDTAFCDAFRHELFHTPNIHMIGWVDISSAEFQNITGKAAALIYPSCAEGQAGSVVMCLQAGLIPIVSRESGLDIEGFGFLLENCSIEEICNQVTRMSSLPQHELVNLSRRAWEYARAHHSEDYYASSYRKIMINIMDSTASAKRGALPTA